MSNNRTKVQLIEETLVLIDKYNDFIKANGLEEKIGIFHCGPDFSSLKKNVILSMNRGILDKLNRLKSKYYGK